MSTNNQNHTAATAEPEVITLSSDEDSPAPTNIISSVRPPNATGRPRSLFRWRKPTEKRKAVFMEDSSDDEDNDNDKDKVVPEVKISHKLMIGGVPLEFPVKPYSAQLAVMNIVSIWLFSIINY